MSGTIVITDPTEDRSLTIQTTTPSPIIVADPFGGSADIVGVPGPQGPMGTLNVVELSQADYNQLDPKVPNTIYLIT